YTNCILSTRYRVLHCSLISCSSLLTHYPSFFIFNATPTTEIYTLSLHDALPICNHRQRDLGGLRMAQQRARMSRGQRAFLDFHLDRKSTRLNSSHLVISYAVFCLKKKKK